MSRRKTVGCSVVDCGRPHTARGMCIYHYKKALRALSVPVRVFLTTEQRIEQFFTSFEERDGHLLWTGGNLDKFGYGRVYLDGTTASVQETMLELREGIVAADGHVVLSCPESRLCAQQGHITVGTRADAVERRYGRA